MDLKFSLPKRGERGISVLVTALILIIVIPMVGLSIDATLLYVVKTKLQGSVDGAALAAAKALSRGSDDTSQIAAAKTAAQTYVRFNYPSTFFFSNDVQVDSTTGVVIDTTVANQRTVTVTATVSEPTLFMRWINISSTLVAATATTVRKDVNIVLVLDRSGSMTASGSCAPMEAAAINFVAKFAPGRDNIGIISFATTTIEQMPITSNFIHDSSETGTGINVTTAINGIGSTGCAGSTSSAEALWYAYNELVGLNQPTALNFIVFFTDGQPTGIDANMPIASGAPCTKYSTSTSTGPAGILTSGIRYIPGLYAVTVDGGTLIGTATPTGTANSNGTPNIINGDQGNSAVANSTNCAYAASWNSNWTKTTDFVGTWPTTDIYGNATVDSSYNALTMSGSYPKLQAPNGLGLAANTANNAAKAIRHGNAVTILSHAGSSLTGVIIHSIGLGNATYPLAADDSFLSRVSNAKTLSDGTTANPGYESAYGSGVYKYAQNTGDLGTAFDDIASEILRIAK